MSKHKTPLCSGFGQYHSENHKTNPQQYIDVTLFDITGRLASPDKTDKASAQWAIFSSLKSRNHDAQRDNGQLYALWADIDEPNGQTFLDMYLNAADIVQAGLMGYTSKSATEDNQKARLIVPLSKPITGSEFVELQTILNDKLQAAGITPDRATERAGQICYLPNEGEFYSFEYDEDLPDFDPAGWAADVKSLRAKQQAELEERNKKREQSKLKAAQRVASGKTSPIDAFNAEYDIETLFNTFGYIQKGDRWLSPNSGSNQPGVIITNNGNNGPKWISKHQSDAGMGIACNGNTIGDPFDLFIHFQHKGDRNAAIKDIAEKFGLNQQNNSVTFESNTVFEDEEPQQEKAPFSLRNFALNGLSKQMRQQMLEDKYVLGRIAIFGQWTVLYAPPNAGKTLITMRLLIDAIKSGQIDGKDVFYINADDNFKGLTVKLEIAEQYGFNMIAPSHQEFSIADFNGYLATMITEDSARGIIIILDTLKKFTDIMDKRLSSEFGRYLRGFVSKGGTVIALAHVNKNRTTDGKVIFSGTSDIVDDTDCAYTLDATEATATHKTVVFENIKSRGDVDSEAAYRYLSQVSGKNGYQMLIDSVEQVGEAEAAQARELQQMQAKLAKNSDIIQEITEVIEQGTNNKTDIIKAVHEVSGASKGVIRKVLTDHTGKDFTAGHRWRVERGEKNAKLYHLLNGGYRPETLAKNYDEATNGH